MSYRHLEHTADLGIEVTAESLERLFVECLRAETDCMTRLELVENRSSREVALTAPELPRLLVDFLGEAIYLHETEGLVLSDAALKLDREEAEWTLSGRVYGEVFELSRHGLKTLLKGVTYHQLEIARRGEEWMARVIFDI